MFDKGIVLFGRSLGQGLEPVSVVGHAVLLGPLLHARSHSVGYGAVELGAVVHHIYQLAIYIGRQVLEHLGTVEHQLSEILGRTVLGSGHLDGFLVESLFYSIKSQICHNLREL